MRGAVQRLSGARAALCTSVAAVALSSAAAAPASDPSSEPSVVIAEARSSIDRLSVGATAAVTVEVEVADGWHINGTGVQEGLEFLIPTSLTFELPPGVRAADVRFPQPVMRTVQLGGAREIGVYEGKVAIEARLLYEQAVAAGGFEPVAVLRYQACTETLCRRPTSLRVVLPVAVDAAEGSPAPGSSDGGAGRLGPRRSALGCILETMALYSDAPVSDSLARSSMPVVLSIALALLAFAAPPAADGRILPRRTALAVRGIGAASLAVFGAIAAPSPAGTSLPFEPFTTEAYDRARTSKMPFVVEFTADWCLPCREMAERTFTDARVVRAGKDLTFLSLDLTTSDRRKELILQSFDVPGAPTTLFFGADGREVTRRVGFIGPEEFARLLEDVRGASEDGRSAPAGGAQQRGI